MTETAERHTVRNEAGDEIAWITIGGCENQHCRRAVKAGRQIHIAPSHRDPRAADWTLAMREHHFATVEEAAAALEIDWGTAVEARTTAERDAAYARGVPVKIAKGVGSAR